MSKKVISVICLFAGLFANAQTCPLLGTVPEQLTNKSNYVIDWFTDTLSFTYALNKCTATSIFSTGLWHMYTCNQSDSVWTVTKREYNDSDCAQPGIVVESWSQGDSEEGTNGYFECTGGDNYVKLTVSPNSTCDQTRTVYAGLSGCTNNGQLLTEFYCDDEEALVHLYLDLVLSPLENETFSSSPAPESLHTNCNPNLYCDKWYFSPSTCAYVAQFLNYRIYGKMDSCVIGSPILSTTAGPYYNTTLAEKAAPSQFAFGSLIIALFLTLFSLF